MSLCSLCGATFECGQRDAPAAACWCMALPPAVPVPPAADVGQAAAGCWCPACLQAHLTHLASLASLDDRALPSPD